MNMLPVNEIKVIDRTIDVYLWVSEDLNTDEVKLLGQRLIDLAERRATDIEQVYIDHRCPEEMHPADDYEPDYIHKIDLPLL